MHSLSRASPSKSLMMVKLDIEKAYDRIHWPFLFHLLYQLVFHHTFIDGSKLVFVEPSFLC